MQFAFYVSGHGYGHATRVSALTCHLLRLDGPQIQVFIVSSAPKLVFADALEMGAKYRNANIDPVIVQPLAYRVDRQQSVAVLKSFLEEKDAMLQTEQAWLKEICADCVLSDAAFLGCLAAKGVGIPSILITNFTFDSVYSYLSTTLVDAPAVSSPDDSHSTIHHHLNALLPDVPVSPEELEPLVEHIHAGYRCADLLLRLPGYIPIPSFALDPPLPSPEWVNPNTNRFTEHVFESLDKPPSSCALHPPITTSQAAGPKPVRMARQIIPIPLLVRSPSPSVYTPPGRSKLLESIGVPPHLHSHKILVVSFGGQVFKRPSGSATPRTPKRLSRELNPGLGNSPSGSSHVTSTSAAALAYLPSSGSARIPHPFPHDHLTLPSPTDHEHGIFVPSPRLATASHLWIPGAPPASKVKLPTTSPISATSSSSVPWSAFETRTIPPTPDRYSPPNLDVDLSKDEPLEPEPEPQIDEPLQPHLLPSASWIAIVCGVSKSQWNDGTADADLPDQFFVAPRDVYMPDLTAAGDVLLGKLGYGSVSECVDVGTAFVYVSRPLFIEEHGLRRLLQKEGVGVELPRELYEAGDWAEAIETAWQMGRVRKELKRRDDGAAGVQGVLKRAEEGREVGGMIVRWVERWNA